SLHIIEKAKGVDIALSAQMLKDAYRNNYTDCYLATSDVDFLPVIQAIRQMGKHVRILGYKDGLAENSPFEHVPDEFIDIGARMIESYEEATRREHWGEDSK